MLQEDPFHQEYINIDSADQKSLPETSFQKDWPIPSSPVLPGEHHFALAFFLQLLHISFV